MNPFNDKPIERPEDDGFGFKNFAKAIAQAITKNKDPEGTVMAVRGPWGSGKSSVINLVRYYLEKEKEKMEKERKSDQAQRSFEFPKSAPSCFKSLAPKTKSDQKQKDLEFPRTAPNWVKSLASKICSKQLSCDTSNSSNMFPKILDFKCWWFKGEEALMLEFFHQLYSALDKSGLREAKAAVSQLGSIILSGSTPLIGTVVNSMAPGMGRAAANGMNRLSNLIKQEDTVENLYEKISQDLENQDKRYLMIIDDIDRLLPDEALLIFRLVKSVGQLPKVTYLLAYDQEVAEKIVSKRYPSEGVHYLEKIVQAGFDIPYPLHPDLRDAFIKFVNELWKESKESIHWKEYQDSEHRHFWDLFNNVVKSQIQSPRDIIRIMNTLKVTWPAVDGEVDPADFLALETLRVKQPSLYATLKGNKQKLTGGVDMNTVSEDKDDKKSRYEGIFLSEFQDEKREEMKTALCRLFPPLKVVWLGNAGWGTDSIPPRDREEWKRQRRACSPEHFDTYFQFSLSPETISIAEVQAVIKNSGNANYVKNALLQASQTQKRNGSGTYSSILLDELKLHVKNISIEHAEVFLSALFEVHDVIDMESDQSSGLIWISNTVRIYFLLESFLLERTTLNKRSEIISHAIQNASLHWIIYLTISEYYKYYPHQGELPKHEDNCLITESDMKRLCEISSRKIEDAVENDELLSFREPLGFLDSWDLLAGSDQSEKARFWCMDKLNDDNAVEIFVKELTSEGWRATVGNLESTRSYSIKKDMLRKFFDVEKFKQRVEEMLRKSEPGSEGNTGEPGFKPGVGEAVLNYVADGDFIGPKGNMLLLQ